MLTTIFAATLVITLLIGLKYALKHALEIDEEQDYWERKQDSAVQEVYNILHTTKAC